MNDPSTGQRSASGEKQKISTHLLLGETLRGRLVLSKSLSTPSRTSNWRKMCANSGKSTATVVDLRAVVRCWVNFLHALDIIKTTDAVLSSIPRESLSALTPECVPHWRSRRTQVPSLDRFRFHRTELQLQLRLFHPPYCTPLLVVASAEWLHYFAKQKKKMGAKSSPDEDEEVLQLSEAIIRRVKWSYKSLLERRGLKMLRFFEKFGKPPFPDLLPVNRCVNDVKRVCRGRIEAALPPTFTTHSSKTRRRIDFGLVAIF